METPTKLLQVGVKALIQDNQGRFLILKNTKVWEGDQEVRWDIPGGRIDPDETVFEGLKREIKEETGLDLIATDRTLTVQDIIRSTFHVVRITYTATAEGKVVLNHSDTSDTVHAEYEWMTKDELKKLPSLDPYLAETLAVL